MYYYVDHTSRFERNTGIQRCVRAIASALISTGVSLQPVVWNRERLDFDLASPSALRHLSGWHGPEPQGWTLNGLPPWPRHGTDAWLLIVELVSGPHQPSADQLRSAAARHGLRLAWVFHDAIPLRWSHLYGAGAAATAGHHAAYMAGLAHADLVLANSHTTARHLHDFLAGRGLPSAHVQPLPLAQEFPGEQRVLPALQPFPSERPWRLLCVGSLEPRKNHHTLLKAVAWLMAQRQFPAELVLVGWPNDPRVVSVVERACGLQFPLRWESNADDARLAELYRWSDATLFPSREEGFGLPVVESLWHGRPCLCSGHGALGELVAQGGCWPLQVDHWRCLAADLTKWFADPTAYAQTQQQLCIRSFTTWRDYARELLLRLEGVQLNTWRQEATPLP